MPEFEWVFACGTVLGSLVQGTRTTSYDGKKIICSAKGSLGAGVRWCSADWQQRAPGQRGRVARFDNRGSHMLVQLNGQIKEACVYLVDDDDLEAAARLLGASLASGPEATDGLFEWSFALARQPGHTQAGVWMTGPGAEQVADRLRTEVGVDWCIDFTPAYTAPGLAHPPDSCTVYDGTGAWRASLADGEVRHEEEAIPWEFIALGFDYGTSLNRCVEEGYPVTNPAPSHRPLEPDELEDGWLRLGPHNEVYGDEDLEDTSNATDPGRS